VIWVEISFVPVSALWTPKKRDPAGTPRIRSIAPSLLAPEKKAPKANESTAADPNTVVATDVTVHTGEFIPLGDHSGP
jgi:hypothetical protein